MEHKKRLEKEGLEVDEDSDYPVHERYVKLEKKKRLGDDE